MEAFLSLCGEMTVGKLVVVICAIVFLYKCYSKVSLYFREKAVKDYEQSKQIQEVIELSKNYPKWRQQSIDKQISINEKMDKMLDKIESLGKANGEGMAYTWRYRILRFDDEVRHGIQHSKEHFDQILEDIDSYESFCKKHPDFPNNKAVFAIKNIKEVYDKCVDENSFL